MIARVVGQTRDETRQGPVVFKPEEPGDQELALPAVLGPFLVDDAASCPAREGRQVQPLACLSRGELEYAEAAVFRHHSIDVRFALVETSLVGLEEKIERGQAAPRELAF